MRLELNLPALERLIGGDTEIEMELRKQIVQTFAGKHLKDLAKDELFKAAVKETQLYVNQIAKETFDVENLTTGHLWPTVGYRIKSLIENLVKDQAQKAVDEALLKIIEYQKRYWSKEIENAVAKKFGDLIEKEIQEGIKKRLQEAVKHLEDAEKLRSAS